MRPGDIVPSALFVIVMAFASLFEWIGLKYTYAYLLSGGVTQCCIALLSGGATLLCIALWYFRTTLVEAIRKFARPPARRKRRSTHMKEFLLLLDKDVRRSCYPHFKHPIVIAGLCIILFNGLLFILHMHSRNWFLAAVVGLGNASLVLLTASLFSKVRYSILLPLYHKRLLAKVQAEYEAAICAFNSKLPDYEYRVGAIPRASRNTVDDLRVRVAEQRLPTELFPVAQRIGQIQVELAEAEQDLADSKATARSQTVT